ncbi:MAG: ATP/GTP-binding protein [Streptosporangiaceae bacterium]
MSPRKARRLPDGMPRRPRGGLRAAAAPGQPAGRGGDPATRLGPPLTQSWPDGDWVVRQVPGAATAKTYRCPGCDQEIRPGTAHLVAWPADAPGPAERRHWHSACWQRRPRRPGMGPSTHR